MATFKYVAKNSSSQTVNGKMTADNKTVVIDELRKRKLIIISLDEVKESSLPKASFRAKKVKQEEIVIFARQLATMVDAGLPILQGLDALQEQVVHPAFKKVLMTVHDDIKNGNSLSAAFAKHPMVFDQLFVNMVRVGETGGVLAKVLERVAGYMEKSLKLRHKVQSAMYYPAIVIFMAMAITTFLLVKVVPTFAGIYDSFGQKLPPITQLLIDTSNFVKSNFLWVIGTIILTIFGLARWHNTDKGAQIIDGAILKMPVFGDLFRKVAISRFTRTLATLVQSGVPILESLDVVQKSIGNRVLEIVVEDVKNTVRQGESIATPLMKSGFFPPMVTRMIAIGEKSGQMEKMLLKVSEFYDDQVDTAVDGLTSIIEPLIIGVLGLVIGFIVVALFMPIISITRLV